MKFSTKAEFLKTIKPLIDNGTVELVSPIFEYTKNNFDAVLKIKPKFFTDHPSIKLIKTDESNSLRQPQEMKNLTKARFLQLKMIGADDQGGVSDTKKNLARYGQSGAQLVLPGENIPYFTLIGGDHTPTSRRGSIKLNSFFGLPIGLLLGNPNANEANYVPNSSNANYIIQHNRATGQLFKVTGDGEKSEIK